MGVQGCEVVVKSSLLFPFWLDSAVLVGTNGNIALQPQGKPHDSDLKGKNMISQISSFYSEQKRSHIVTVQN